MKCPGQDSRYWKPGAIFEASCPKCGKPVEFFKDDPTRRCGSCGNKFVNPNMDFGCAAYCRFAEQCIGDLPPELIAERQELMKDRIAVEMKKHYRSDFKKIGHATRVARHAEKIAAEIGGDLPIILGAAYLHGTITGGENDAAEARNIMEKAGASEKMTDEVTAIISRLGSASSGISDDHAADDTADTPEDRNYQIVHDGKLIAEIEASMTGKSETGGLGPERIQDMIRNRLYTDTAKQRAKNILNERHKEVEK